LRRSGKDVAEVRSGGGVAQHKAQGYRYRHSQLPVPAREAYRKVQSNATVVDPDLPAHAHDWLLRHIGEFVDEDNFDDKTTSVGHVFLPPEWRVPPTPSYPILASFVVASPNAPIVELHARRVPCENSHIVFDTVFTSTDGANNTLGGMDNNGVMVVRLFTVRAIASSMRFD
jgi:hypothetical protein